jgi:hypothetical protein
VAQNLPPLLQPARALLSLQLVHVRMCRLKEQPPTAAHQRLRGHADPQEAAAAAAALGQQALVPELTVRHRPPLHAGTPWAVQGS